MGAVPLKLETDSFTQHGAGLQRCAAAPIKNG